MTPQKCRDNPPCSSSVTKVTTMKRRLRQSAAVLASLILASGADSSSGSQFSSLATSSSSLIRHRPNRSRDVTTSLPLLQIESFGLSSIENNSAFIFMRLLERRRTKRGKEEKDDVSSDHELIVTAPKNSIDVPPKNGISINNGRINGDSPSSINHLKSEGDRYLLLSRASQELQKSNGHEIQLNNNGDDSKIINSIGSSSSSQTTPINKGGIIRPSKQDSEWAKRNARSIDEGIRFKSQLREGLEEQSKLHRERLLSDILQGVISGGTSALDTIERKGSNPFKWFSFGRGGGNSKEGDGGEKEEVNAEEEGILHSSNITTDETESLDDENKQTRSGSSSSNKNSNSQSRFGARTIAGLINALAEEVDDLEVEVDADPTTPFWNKKVDSIKIYFSRLGFQQLRMGGLDQVFNELENSLEPSEKFSLASSLFSNANKTTTADEAFDRIDTDHSGALDADELAEALKMAAVLGGNKVGMRSKDTVAELASRLIRLYDTNGDGVVDKEEYRVMVQDMAALRDARLRKELHQEPDLDDITSNEVGGKSKNNKGWRQMIGKSISSAFGGEGDNATSLGEDPSNSKFGENIIDVTDNEAFWGSMDQGEGSIVLSDLRLDLRRLLFGAIPVAKRILPGGPLILKPFTATVTASFNREDILDSFVLDAGLRRLVARALSRRVRGVRDFLDGAVFYGRTWKLFEQNSPLVEVPKLQDVQFDKRNRLIITGRARIKASPDAPSIENGFKLRTKIGTRDNGRIIGLLEPEIAIFAECPKALEDNVRTKCKEWFDYTIPQLKPVYTYIPLVSPLKKNDKLDGFNLGEDNQLKSIEIKNGKLRFEMSAVLRPGRFLGNHYLAFTVPIRTLIVTVDRVKEGMRVARRNKLLADKAAREMERLAAARGLEEANGGPYNEIYAQSISGKSSISNEGKSRIRRLEKEIKATIQEDVLNRDIEVKAEPNNGKSFLSRFVEGYTGAIREELDLEMNARLSSSISDFFGSQESDDEMSRSDAEEGV